MKSKKSARSPSDPGITDAIEILHRRYYAGSPERMAALDEERVHSSIARQIHELRIQQGLTQAQLARVVGTTASVISRLEDADYEGHSLNTLRRIAASLGRQVEISFPPSSALFTITQAGPSPEDLQDSPDPHHHLIRKAA